MDDELIDDGPLEWRNKPVSFPQIPAEMVASIALGMEDDLIVAARHGFSIEQYRALESQPFFRRQVEAKRSEFQKTGVTFRAKAAWMAEDLLDKVYLEASRDDAPFAKKHEVLKTMMKAAGLEKTDAADKVTGPTFSISIDLGGGQSINLSSNPSITSQASNTLPAIDVDAKTISSETPDE